MKKVKPPKKLSQAIMLALNDLALVEKNPKYEVDMADWHYYEDDTCFVCFAGSIIAQTFGVNPKKTIWANSFDADWKHIFYALDGIRKGDIVSALGFFYPDKPISLFEEYEHIQSDFINNGMDYLRSPEEFKNAMCDIAMMLESHGY